MEKKKGEEGKKQSLLNPRAPTSPPSALIFISLFAARDVIRTAAREVSSSLGMISKLSMFFFLSLFRSFLLQRERTKKKKPREVV